MAKLELTVIENGGLCLDILRHSPALGRYAHRIDALADLQSIKVFQTRLDNSKLKIPVIILNFELHVSKSSEI